MQEEIGNSVFLANHYPNTPIRAMFITGSPSTTQTKILWADTTTLLINSPKITFGKQLSDLHVYQGLVHPTQTTSVWVVGAKITTLNQLSKPHVYQGKTEPLHKSIKPQRETQQPQIHLRHTFSTTQSLRKFCHEFETITWFPYCGIPGILGKDVISLCPLEFGEFREIWEVMVYRSALCNFREILDDSKETLYHWTLWNREIHGMLKF